MKQIVLSIAMLSTLTAGAQTSGTEGARGPLSLEQVIDSARQHNMTLRNAQREVAMATEQRKEAFTNYFPSVSATGLWFNANTGMAKTTINPAEVIPTELATSLAGALPAASLAALASPITMSMMKNGTIASVMAVQPVFAGGQIVNGNKLAKVGEAAARLQLEMSENEVVKTAEQYYWQLTALQEKRRTVEAAESLLTALQHDVEAAVKAGVALRNDLLQVQLRLNDTESQQLKLDNAIGVMRQLMAQYCGLSSEAFELEVPDYDAPVEMPLYKDPAEALPQTVEYQLLSKQVEAARLQQKTAIGKNMPSVAVGAGYNYHTVMDTDHTFGMIFATVSVPLSDWWGGSHAIKRKKLEYERAVDEQTDKSELLKIGMQNAWNAVTEARLQLTLAERSKVQAEENLRLQRNFYRAGTTTLSDLLEAQLLHQQSVDRRTDAYAEYRNKLREAKIMLNIH